MNFKTRSSEIIPKKHRKGNSEPITNKGLIKAVSRIQKRVEGQYLDAKISLSKYSLLYEQQRLIAHRMRERVLNDTEIIAKSVYFSNDDINTVSSAELSFALKAITLYAINSCWSDHLLNMEAALDEVQVIGKFSSNPFDSFNEKLIEYFSTFEKDILNKIVDICENTIVKDNHIDLEMMGIQAPASTKTYMLLDGTENINLINELAAVSNPILASLYFVYMMFSYFSGRKNRKK